MLPMVDADENAVIVNALQRRADVIAQKSLAEGFGLTVAEAMWKGRPVVASSVGGIQDQIEDGRTGLLVDPTTSTPSAPRSTSCSTTCTAPSAWARPRRRACATSSSARATSASTSRCSSGCSSSAPRSGRRRQAASAAWAAATRAIGTRNGEQLT